MHYQARSYLLSEELQASVKLLTKVRTLKHIEPQCLQIIMETLHSATNIFRSNQTHLQMAFLILFSAASAACPGSIIESACYCSSNEALTWGDIDFYLIPDDEDPAYPYLVVNIQLNLVKGYRDMDHKYQKLLFTLELCKEHHMTFFAHFHSIESLLCPEKPPTMQNPLLHMTSTAVAASSGRDTNAPQHLSLEERAKLLNELELVKLQNTKDEATNKIQQLLANEQSEEVKKRNIELRQLAAKASNAYCFMYLHESDLHIKQACQKFLDKAAVRQMVNLVHNP
ncbi:hypothetical protein EV359DRAFT_61495 [Lentinula novae-zelandiae]|nr:hypothetical protein EV359DRAFT_61495 [Lentinula novae-zelandiae]